MLLYASSRYYQVFSVDFNAPKVTTVTMDTADNTTSNTIQFDLNTITDMSTGTGTGTAAYYVKDNSDNATSAVKPSASARVGPLSHFTEATSLRIITHLTDKDDTGVKHIFSKTRHNG